MLVNGIKVTSVTQALNAAMDLPPGMVSIAELERAAIEASKKAPMQVDETQTGKVLNRRKPSDKDKGPSR